MLRELLIRLNVLLHIRCLHRLALEVTECIDSYRCGAEIISLVPAGCGRLHKLFIDNCFESSLPLLNRVKLLALSDPLLRPIGLCDVRC